MKSIRGNWQARTPLERRLSVRLKDAPAGTCLTFEQLLELARRGRRATDYHALMLHIVSCPACRSSYLQMRAIIKAQRPSLKRWLSRFVAPKIWVHAFATGAAALIFALFFWQTRLPAPPPGVQPSGSPIVRVQSSEPSSSNSPMRDAGTLPQLADSRTKPPSFNSTILSSVERELQSAGQYASFVEEAVQFVSSLTSLTTRSDGQRPQPWLHLKRPDIESNSSIEPGAVSFEWLPVENATGYRVRVDSAGEAYRTIEETRLEPTETQFTLREPLPAGEYELTIIVEQAGQERVYRRKFYVLNTERLHQLEWARQHIESKPLLSAAVFYALDRYAEALVSLKHAARRHSNDPLVKQWGALVEERVQERKAEFTTR
jgi:hypothetical protein